MGIQSHQYRSFTMIRKRVLQVAVDEINSKTDIEVKFDLEKQGRRIIGINFKMRTRNNQPMVGIEQQDEIQKKLKLF